MALIARSSVVINIDLGRLIVVLLVGCAAGWLAGQLVKGRGFGVIGNTVVGVIGAFVGGVLFDLLGIHFGGDNFLGRFIGDVITATIGAVACLVLLIALTGDGRRR